MTHMFPGLKADDLSDNEDRGVERLRVTAHSGAHIQSTLPGVTPRSWTAESRARPHPLGLCARTPAAARLVGTQIASLEPSTRLLHCNIIFRAEQRPVIHPAEQIREERILSWSARTGFSTQKSPDLGKCAMCADAAARFKNEDFREDRLDRSRQDETSDLRVAGCPCHSGDRAEMDVIGQTAVASPLLQYKRDTVVNGTYAPAFTVQPDHEGFRPRPPRARERGADRNRRQDRERGIGRLAFERRPPRSALGG